MKRQVGLLFSIFIVVSMACQFIPSALTNTTVNTPAVKATEVSAPPAEQPTSEPVTGNQTATAKPATGSTSEKPVATEQNASGDYHEEFDTAAKDATEFKTNYPNWKDPNDPVFPLMLPGTVQQNAQFFTQDSQLIVKLSAHKETHLKAFENDHIYKDVVVSTEYENVGTSHSKVALLCGIDKTGWFEFQISSEGFYWIYRYDTALKAQGKVPYTVIADQLGSTDIVTGNKKNVFSMECSANQFKFFINGKELTNDKMKIPQTKLDIFKNKFPQNGGSTGLGVYSLSDASMDTEIHFNYFDAKVPQQ